MRFSAQSSQAFNPIIHFQVLLQSDKIEANFSDRSLLKNLGHFLGMVTLPKNKPILFEVLDMDIFLCVTEYMDSLLQF